MDPFKVLGIPEDATEEDAKKAHRMLSKKYHPDLNPKSGSNYKMVEINLAYDAVMEILKNRRNNYSQSYSTYQDNNFGNGNYYEDDRDDKEKTRDSQKSYQKRNDFDRSNTSGSGETFRYTKASDIFSGAQDPYNTQSANNTGITKYVTIIIYVIVGCTLLFFLVSLIISIISGNNDGLLKTINRNRSTAAASRKAITNVSNNGGFWQTIGNIIGGFFKVLWSALQWLLNLVLNVLGALWNALKGIIVGLFLSIFG